MLLLRKADLIPTEQHPTSVDPPENGARTRYLVGSLCVTAVIGLLLFLSGRMIQDRVARSEASARGAGVILVDVSDSDRLEMPAQRDAALPAVSLSVGRPFLAGTIGKAGADLIAFKDRALRVDEVAAVQAQLRLVETLPPDVQGTAVSQQIWEKALWLRSQGGGWIIAATDGMDDYSPRLTPPSREEATMFHGIRVLLLGTRQDHPRAEGLLLAAGAKVTLVRDPQKFAAHVTDFMGGQHKPWGGRLCLFGLLIWLATACGAVVVMRSIRHARRISLPEPEPARRWVGLNLGATVEGGYLLAGDLLVFSNVSPSSRTSSHGEQPLDLPATEPPMRLLFRRERESVVVQNLCVQPLVILQNEEPRRVLCQGMIEVMDGDCIWAPNHGELLEWTVVVADNAPESDLYSLAGSDAERTVPGSWPSLPV